MPEPKTDILVKSVESLLTQKQAVAEKEKGLVDGLNRVLSKMGYQVVAKRLLPANGRRRRRGRRGPGRPPGSGARRRGRPPKTMGERSTAGRRGRPPKAAGARKRRGRPPKTA